MKSIIPFITKNISNILIALVLSIAVWIFAISDSDPTVEQVYPKPVPVEYVGKDASLVLVNSSASQVTMTLSAPQSIWDQLTNDPSLVRVLADLSDLGPGEHEVETRIQIGIIPVRIIDYSPTTLNIELDRVVSETFPIRVVVRGTPAIGYQADTPVLDISEAVVSGPAAMVEQISELRALLDVDGASENINLSINLQAVDSNAQVIDDVTINPAVAQVNQPITQLGGYRNVVVKVVTTGQVASGYRVTNISVFPAAVTVFSNDPGLVERLPGYVETLPIDLTGLKDDRDISISLNLPADVSAVGYQQVDVQVGIAAIEGSITLENMPVTYEGLGDGLVAEFSPQMVDVILSGPLPVLDALRTTDIHIIINLEGLSIGVYQRTPVIQIDLADIVAQSVLPGSIEVSISRGTGIPPTPTENVTEGAAGVSSTPIVTPSP